MKDMMKAIKISEYGGPSVLQQALVELPRATPGTAVVKVRAFGLNHAEAYFRAGLWGDVPRITGIECVGEIHEAGDSRLEVGQKVVALMGGMGRTIDGSYAEFVRVPVESIVPIQSSLSWPDLAALPESYATAWVLLNHTLEIEPGQTLLVRGGTSALGQAVINIARQRDVRVLATTRRASRRDIVERLGAIALLDGPELSREVLDGEPEGIDAAVDIVGTATLPSTLETIRYRGRVALAGFLGGGEPLTLDPLTQMPSGVLLGFFASAFTFGTPDLPMKEIPFGELVGRTESGEYLSKPAHIFEFGEIVRAHELMESGNAEGKIVVRVAA